MSGGLFGDILQTGITGAGALQQIDAAEAAGEQFVEGSRVIGEEAKAGTEFRPFSVASSTGNVDVSNKGDITATLSDPLQGLQDKAFSGADALFDQAAVAPGARQTEIFNQLMATLNPEFARRRESLDATAFAQGRNDMRTSAFGGTPEQFAFEKAQNEAMLNALVQARGIGSAEQLQQANIGTGMLASGQSLDAGLFNQINPAIQSANLAQTGQIAGQNLSSQAQVAGLEGDINAQKVASDLYGQLYGSVGQLANNASNQIGGLFKGGEDGSSYADKLLDVLF